MAKVTLDLIGIINPKGWFMGTDANSGGYPYMTEKIENAFITTNNPKDLENLSSYAKSFGDKLDGAKLVAITMSYNLDKPLA